MLVVLSAFGMAGGYIACIAGNLILTLSFARFASLFDTHNIFMMQVKAVVFDFITTVACYQGFFVTGGSIELGRASTAAVVIANILIFLADYVIALLMT